MPKDVLDMKNPAIEKEVIVSNPLSNSFGAISSSKDRQMEDFEKMKEEGASRLASEASEAGSVVTSSGDPVAGKILSAAEAEAIFTRQKKLKMTGTVSAAGLAVGDRVYHKKRKKEATIKDLNQDETQARVKFDTGEKVWVHTANLVKL